MAIGWTRYAAVAYLLTGLCVVGARAQGDPNKTFDPATAAVRKHGATVRVDLIGDSTQTDHTAGYGRRGFCANLTEKIGLREHGARRGEHTIVPSAGNLGSRAPDQAGLHADPVWAQ